MIVIRKLACPVACLIGIVVVAPDAAALDLVDVANLVQQLLLAHDSRIQGLADVKLPLVGGDQIGLLAGKRSQFVL